MALISSEIPISQLRFYISTALRHGATASEIQYLINQSSAFYGVPRALTAQHRVAEVLAHFLKRSPYTEERVQVNDHSTIVQDSNPESNAVPIILIHAIGLDRRMWNAVFTQLTSQDQSIRIVSYDLRGHGAASSAPPTQSLAHLASDLRDLLNKLDILRADIYGQSYGGAVAQYFGLNYPHYTRSLGLVTTAGELGSRMAGYEWS
ncbi:uncharacterized protein Z518_06166 [Rhinocladiella mackenziei CBS 650.93]|uniref:AB hydrolase-1 domain-containing protein n=1 Tax=Rhinocladiella mackenziei CBS 650.93 TaxID=1442369 RepID=A0A0D2IHM6_9EURO|nr:uncharacterized protein Z518_06166 [Rhinocladiella mackenziei CBS 650.93]KIX05294.1 hypothetical protein Z518_06166 [Rhinocladiella mackenziei CBS 650.93]